jgi:hypothetical protein
MTAGMLKDSDWNRYLSSLRPFAVMFNSANWTVDTRLRMSASAI